jgi:hypothetical protein
MPVIRPTAAAAASSTSAEPPASSTPAIPRLAVLIATLRDTPWHLQHMSMLAAQQQAAAAQGVDTPLEGLFGPPPDERVLNACKLAALDYGPARRKDFSGAFEEVMKACFLCTFYTTVLPSVCALYLYSTMRMSTQHGMHDVYSTVQRSTVLFAALSRTHSIVLSASDTFSGVCGCLQAVRALSIGAMAEDAFASMIVARDRRCGGRTALHWCCTVPQSESAMETALLIMLVHPQACLRTTYTRADDIMDVSEFTGALPQIAALTVQYDRQ